MKDKNSQIFIACAMLMDEIRNVYQKNNIKIPIVWMKRGLHSYPDALHSSLQKIIDEHQDYKSILLSYGMCGNSTIGLSSANTKLVIPKFHDCIHQLLQKENQVGHMYLTRCWTLDKESMQNQCDFILTKYGKEQGQEIIREIYGAYTHIDVIYTGSYKIEPIIENAKKTAEPLRMQVSSIKGSVDIIEKLLTEKWDNNFIVLKPGEKLSPKYFFE